MIANFTSHQPVGDASWQQTLLFPNNSRTKLKDTRWIPPAFLDSTGSLAAIDLQTRTRFNLQDKMHSLQQQGFAPSAVSGRWSHSPVTSYGIHSELRGHTPATFVAPSHPNSNLFTSTQTILPHTASQTDLHATHRPRSYTSHRNIEHQRWMQQSQYQMLTQQQQQQREYMNQHYRSQQARGHAVPQYHSQAYHLHAAGDQLQHMFQHQPPNSRPGYEARSLLSTQQSPLERSSPIVAPQIDSLATTHSHLQISVSSRAVSIAQSATELRTPEISQPQSSITSLTPQKPAPAADSTPRSTELSPRTSQPDLEVAVDAEAEDALRNKLAERTRREKQSNEETKQRAKRRREALMRDPGAIYHSYDEVLKCFPLGRGECPNPYFKGLLANQPPPDEPTSDLGRAIRYAKIHWQEYWELKDLDYVADKAKEELEMRREKRRRTSSFTA
ncbi:hypothetical protein OPT61_g7092 [Boeremia exigua]|uniref:Uncharacterized protein n=1 Tax=Boeremia exigua TaxID=749465 RepID=A0ACC2I4K8_9PLEO|nr:hypothetical protein OPT61_g7092 [Boeremia exigua]